MEICTFRLDDITADMDWDRFYRIKGIFDKYQVKPLLGVVPDNRDPKLSVEQSRTDFWEMLKSMQEDGWSIAQHGYQHVYESRNGGILKLKNVSEFAGLSYEMQTAKIKTGKKILEQKGLQTNIFMAPGHTYDEVTLRVLRENGFQYITDGYSNCCYKKQGILHIPSRNAKPKLEKGIDTICLHGNHMSVEDIAQLDRFIRENRDSIVNYHDLLQVKAAGKGLFICCNERKNLLLRSIRKAISTNPKAHAYMVKTDCGNKYHKMWKRVIGIPYLAAVILCSNRKKG